MNLKKISLQSISLLLLGFGTIPSTKKTSSFPYARKHLENIRLSTSIWKNATIGETTAFTFNGKSYSLAYVSEDDAYKGYLILDSDNTLCTYYVGEAKPDLANLASLSPIFSSDDIDTTDKILHSTSTADEFHATPTLNEDLYTSHYDSYSSSQYLTSCPFYYNYSYGPVKNGCAPTTGAMLISFYDRYSSMTNLVNGLLPLEHSDNKEAVDSLIIEVADYMKTDTTNGATLSNEMSGLNQYFSDAGYSNYRAYYLDTFAEYVSFINTKKSPCFLRVKTENNVGHAVLGIGVANLRYSGNFMITHYDWKTSNTGDYYVNESKFVGFIYMGEK